MGKCELCRTKPAVLTIRQGPVPTTSLRVCMTCAFPAKVLINKLAGEEVNQDDDTAGQLPAGAASE